MALLGIKRGNSIIILKPISDGEYEEVQTLDAKPGTDDFFVDEQSNLFVLCRKQLYVLKNGFKMLKTREIERFCGVNSAGGCVFYYLSGGKLYSKRACANEVLVKETEHGISNFFAAKNGDICCWSGKTFTVCSKSADCEEKIPFEVKSVQPNGGKYVIFDVKNNIYVFNNFTGKIEGGLKSLGVDVVFYVSSPFVPLVALSTTKNVFILDTRGKQIFRTIELPDVVYMKFIAENIAMLVNDKVWMHDLVSNESVVVYSKKPELCLYFEEDDGLIKSVDDTMLSEIGIEEKIRGAVLDLKVEMVREIFSLRRQVEELRTELRDREVAGQR